MLGAPRDARHFPEKGLQHQDATATSGVPVPNVKATIRICIQIAGPQDGIRRMYKGGEVFSITLRYERAVTPCRRCRAT